MPGSTFEWNSTMLVDRVREWVLDLEEFPQALAAVRKLDDRGQCWEQYRELLQPLRSSEWAGKLESLVGRIRELLFAETGINVLRCGATMSGNQARLVELLVGCALRENVTMHGREAKERPLFLATMTKDNTVGGSYLGNALKGNAIGLHTDASGTIDQKVHVLSMLYIRPARFGGQSVVSSSRLAFRRLSERAREILQRSFPRQTPYQDPDNPSELLLCLPIFSGLKNGSLSQMEFSYHPARLRNGVKLARASKDEVQRVRYNADELPDALADDERGALDELDKRLREGSCEISLMPNDILMLNNSIVTHDRRPFWDDPRAPRIMERFWAGEARKYEVDDPHHHIGELSCASCR